MSVTLSWGWAKAMTIPGSPAPDPISATVASLWKEGCDGDAIFNMALPDPLPFFGANQAAFDRGGSEGFGVTEGLPLLLWKVASRPRFT